MSLNRNSSRRSNSPKSTISAQELLKQIRSDAKYGFLRQQPTGVKSKLKIDWGLRFVVLTHNALYIFDSDSAKSPKKVINLQGYISVKREENNKKHPWAFSINPIEKLPTKKVKYFASTSNSERREWMRFINERLYVANNVDMRSSVSADIMERLSILNRDAIPEEEELEYLEIPVALPANVIVEISSRVDTDSEDNISECSSSGSGMFPRKLSLFDDKINEYEEEEERNGYDQCESLRKLKTDIAINEDDLSASASGGIFETSSVPPRYSRVVDSDNQPDYMNLKQVNLEISGSKERNIERACEMIEEDFKCDREACIELLKNTKQPGAYLVRNSRSCSPTVKRILAILYKEDSVREFAINIKDGVFSLEASLEFQSLGALLAHYSNQKTIPNIKLHLSHGIHELNEVTGYDSIN